MAIANQKIQWHPGFYAGLMISLRKNKGDLYYHEEYQLSRKPLQMDLMIQKPDSNKVIDTPIGWIFRKYNVIEYKNPDDELSVDQLFKVISYAFLFKGQGDTVNEISVKELTISIFRHRFPRKLFQELREMDATIERRTDGIYYIRGITMIPMQIVVTRELKNEEYVSLKVLTRNADVQDIRAFIHQTESFVDSGDKNNADAVMQVSTMANKELYDMMRRDSAMCEALRNIMKDEIDAEVNKRVDAEVTKRVDAEVTKRVDAEVTKRVDAEVTKRVDAELVMRDTVIARKMLVNHEPVEKIIQYTELAMDKITELANSIGIQLAK